MGNKSNYNIYDPVQIAYLMLVDHRDNGADLDIDAVIGYLGEASE